MSSGRDISGSSHDTIDYPLYNPLKDASKDENIEALKDAAINAEAGKVKEEEWKVV